MPLAFCVNGCVGPNTRFDLVYTSSSVFSRAAQVLRDPYLRKIVQAGGFPVYERRHVNALAATFGPKLGLLPEIARVVVAFAFHCGYY